MTGLDLSVDGRVAIVTGAARGIGAAYARGLAEAGAAVVLVDLDGERGAAVADDIRSGGGVASFESVDVSDAAAVARLAGDVRARHGGIDILVNNAALEGAPTPRPILDLRPGDVDRAMAVNVKGMVLMAQAVVPSMSERGGGAIVNQSSIGAYVGYPGTLPYSSSKMAIIGITRVMAREFGPQGIRVNSIAPGVVATESVMDHTSTDVIDQIVAQQCLPVMQQPADLVGPLLFLVTDASRFVTGQTLIVDGGVVLSP
jgi:NAD(P)-dependent dehydrogenase (short-subunit alcohol dehydrogenase family)